MVRIWITFIDPVMIMLVFMLFATPLISIALTHGYPTGIGEIYAYLNVVINNASVEAFLDLLKSPRYLPPISKHWLLECCMVDTIDRIHIVLGIVAGILGSYVAALICEGGVGITLFSKPLSIRKLLLLSVLMLITIDTTASLATSIAMVKYFAPYLKLNQAMYVILLVWRNLFSLLVFYSLLSFITALAIGKAFAGIGATLIMSLIVVPLSSDLLWNLGRLLGVYILTVSSSLNEISIFDVYNLIVLALLVTMIVRGWEVVKK